MYRVLFGLLLIVSGLILYSLMQGAAIEPGVSLTLAKDRASRIHDLHYDLNFNIPESKDKPIDALSIISFSLNGADQDLQLDFREDPKKLHSILVNGQETAPNHQAEHIILPAALLQEGANTVELKFTAGNSSLNRADDFLYTLFVPDRARTAYPVFDQPDLKATYGLTLSVPEGWNALSAGTVESTETKEGITRYRFAKSDAMSSYLFSFVAGRFQVVTRTVMGREMTLLHRETDAEKITRNLDAIFALHGEALKWLEDYTGISYPFQKFDFAAIPAFQYGGMEHVGAIQYRASTLFLDDNPSQTQLLARAGLIAHETAHMWFGDLVTMKWFDDVWTKEVFANFMASKIVNPSFPDIDHDLNFLLSRYPAAYSVDRTEGANPIRQPLSNLNEAGTLYGAIIYNKAPIMMRQLELLIGEADFQKGMQQYLQTFAGGNATWPDLVAILDELSDVDLKKWSDVWVTTPGRPHFEIVSHKAGLLSLSQKDPANQIRVWAQTFAVNNMKNGTETRTIKYDDKPIMLEGFDAATDLFLNSDGKGYGLFPISLEAVARAWTSFSDLQKGAALIALNESMLEGNDNPGAESYFEFLRRIVEEEENQLLLNVAFNQIDNLLWNTLPDSVRKEKAEILEWIIWERILIDAEDNPSLKKLLFNRMRGIAVTDESLRQLKDILEDSSLEGLSLSDRERITLTANLAIKMPYQAKKLLAKLGNTLTNPDDKARLAFLTPVLLPDPAGWDSFFESLKTESGRERENWVLEALGYLHHPLRRDYSEKYIEPSLELMVDIQRTGDIFFPAGWAGQTLSNHVSETAAQTVRDFLSARPEYNHQLRLKILQAADPLFRAAKIRDQKRPS